MNYYEFTFTLSPNTEANRDILAAVLADAGFESFTDNTEGIDAYVAEKFYSKEVVDEVLKDFPLEDVQFSYTVQFVETKDWNEEWEKNFFQPIIISNQCVIHSSFHKDIPSLPYDIVIDPKMAFGTGHHETTSLMMSYLLQANVENCSFLDMGCGTAVLAILAKMKHAARVVAIDIDEWAYNNAIENIQLNNTPDIEIQLGDAALLGKETFDFIFANINRNILLNDIHSYVSCMKQGSALYMSGFYESDLPLIQAAAEKNGLRFVSYVKENNWVAVHFAR